MYLWTGRSFLLLFALRARQYVINIVAGGRGWTRIKLLPKTIVKCDEPLVNISVSETNGFIIDQKMAIKLQHFFSKISCTSVDGLLRWVINIDNLIINSQDIPNNSLHCTREAETTSQFFLWVIRCHEGTESPLGLTEIIYTLRL